VEWLTLHNDGLYDLYSSPNIIRVIKSRRIKWAGHVSRMRERRGIHGVLVGKPRKRGHLKDPDIDGNILLRRIFRKWDGEGTELMWLRLETSGGYL
jgi:hypothetical protein